MVTEISQEELKKTSRLLGDLTATPKYKQKEGSHMVHICIALNGLQQEVDDFYESINSNDYDQPDPQDVLDAILDNNDLDKYRAELSNVISTDKAEKVIEEIES